MSEGVLPAGPRLEERARAARAVRRRVRARRLGWVTASVTPFLVVAWLLLGSPWLVVDRVVVQGQHRLSVAAVLAAAGVPEGVPLARVDTDAVASRVRALGPVASVSVTRDWPGTLRVSLVERVPVAAVAAGSTFTLVDVGGVLIGSTPSLPAGIVRLVVAKPGPSDPSTRAALSVLDQLPKQLRPLVGAVHAASPEQVTLVLKDRRRVVWGGTADGPAKAAALVPLLELGGRVFDVSSPSVVTRR